jgi:orotate phosphoribosyltransferase
VGYEVEEVISLVDRQQGGEEFYQSVGLKFQSIFQIPELQVRYAQLNIKKPSP